MRLKTILLSALIGAAVPLAAATPPEDAVAALLGSPARTAEDREADARRKPTELLRFAGVEPGMVVVDLWPGGGYWTRLFSAAVGPAGQVIGYVPAEIVGARYKPLDSARATAANLPNVMVVSEPQNGQTAQEHESSVDLIWTSQNYHDMRNIPGTDMAAVNRNLFRVLKPGGALVVIDHVAPAGSGATNAKDLHRIDPVLVEREVTGAGFVLEARSTALANPADPHTANVFDPAIRGRTDQFVYRFRKPRA